MSRLTAGGAGLCYDGGMGIHRACLATLAAAWVTGCTFDRISLVECEAEGCDEVTIVGCETQEDCGEGELCEASKQQCLKLDGEACVDNVQCLGTCVQSECGPLAGMGQLCEQAEDCEPQSTCVLPSDGSGGFAEVGNCRGEVDAPCDEDGDCGVVCIALACADLSPALGPCDTSSDCQTGGECLDGVCRLAIAEPCLENAVCIDTCIRGFCAPMANPSQTCDESTDCTAGSCFSGKCRLDDGAGCSINAQCLNTCIGGLCEERNGPGEPCDGSESFDCAEGSLCMSSVCKGSTGQPCDADLDCQGICLGTSCAPRQPTGGECFEDGDCQAGNACIVDTCLRVDTQPCGENADCVNVCIHGSCAPQAINGGGCDESGDCPAGNECTSEFLCGLVLGQACDGPDAPLCGSGECVDGVCCESPCDGLCMACGSDGLCNDVPSDDAACGTVYDALDTTCRNYAPLSAGRCEALGVCKTASEANCPSHSDANGSVSCRDPVSVCDAEDFCDGAGGCPDDKSAGAECRPAVANGCGDEAELCDGVSNVCPAQVITTCGVVNYRSIGTQTAPLFTGGCSFSGAQVTFTQPLALNIGRGDKIATVGTPFILDVDADRMSATLQAPVADFSGSCAVVRAFNTLQAWEDALTGDLTSAGGRSEVGLMYDDGDFAGALLIDGSTTSAGNTITLEPAQGQHHAGLAGSGLVLVGGHVNGITIADSHVTVRGLEVASGKVASLASVVVSGASGVLLERLMVHDSQVGGIHVAADAQATVQNTLVYGAAGVGIRMAGSTGAVQSCTVFGGTTGVQVSSTVRVVNTIAMGAATDFAAIDQTNTLSSDGTGDPLTFQDPVAVFLAPGADFHLRPDSPAVDSGADASQYTSEDLETNPRPMGLGTDIGADEVPSAVFECGIGCPTSCCCGACVPEGFECVDVLCSGDGEL